MNLMVNANFNGQEIAPLLLLPLVENAAKHGLSPPGENNWLTVNIGLQQST